MSGIPQFRLDMETLHTDSLRGIAYALLQGGPESPTPALETEIYAQASAAVDLLEARKSPTDELREMLGYWADSMRRRGAERQRMTRLDEIAEILSELEMADDTASKLYSLMSTFESESQRTYRRLMAVPGFKKLWEGIAEAVDRAGGFEGR